MWQGDGGVFVSVAFCQVFAIDRVVNTGVTGLVASISFVFFVVVNLIMFHVGENLP